MVNNAININNTNNHLPHLTIEHKKHESDDGNPCSGLGREHKCDGVKPVNGNPNCLL
jgi:hypothetical protein